MSARIRDLVKTRAQRIGEVFSILHLKGGQANSQLVAFGGNITVHTTNTQLALSDTCAVIGQAIIDKAAAVAIAVAVGGTGAGQFRKVLIELQADGTVVQTNGPISSTDQASATLPAEDPTRVTLGWLELPASFVPGTTAVTAGMIKKTAYWT